jgi:hypothetical protein
MELAITMIPALEDPSERGPDYQRQLAEFAKSLRKAGIEYEASTLLLTETSPFIYAGRFVIKLLQTAGPVGLAVRGASRFAPNRKRGISRLQAGFADFLTCTTGC